MAQICSITKAKQNLLELVRRTQSLGESYVLVKAGKPISALLPFDEYESLLETLDILETEPDILNKLKRASRDVAGGAYKIWRHKKGAAPERNTARPAGLTER